MARALNRNKGTPSQAKYAKAGGAQKAAYKQLLKASGDKAGRSY